MRARSFVIILALFAVGNVARAHHLDPEFVAQRELAYTHPRECVNDDTCDLRAVRFKAEDYTLPDEHPGDAFDATRLYAEYETANMPALRKYLFVQFVRGCVFNTQVLTDGTIATLYHRTRTILGRRYLYYFPDWVVDSNDATPGYEESDEGQNGIRQYSYEWRPRGAKGFPELSAREMGGNYYGVAPPPTPRLYVVDYPDEGKTTEFGVRNVSLEFRMCLYRERDVPRRLFPGERIEREPVVCFPWRNSHMFNHSTGKYERPAGIVEECKLSRPPASPSANVGVYPVEHPIFPEQDLGEVYSPE